MIIQIFTNRSKIMDTPPILKLGVKRYRRNEEYLVIVPGGGGGRIGSKVDMFTIDTVSSTGMTGRHTAITLDSDDKPHIAYIDFNYSIQSSNTLMKARTTPGT